ncbi:MAG: YciI family protein [Thermoleophilia bacterium]
MQYMLLIHDDPAVWAAMSEQEVGALMGEYLALSASMKEAGVFVDGAPLQPADTATSVRVREGRTLTTDGPFAETKEQLGGYYLVEVESLDDALAWAARIPSARLGTIEVRPLRRAEVPA